MLSGGAGSSVTKPRRNHAPRKTPETPRSGPVCGFRQPPTRSSVACAQSIGTASQPAPNNDLRRCQPGCPQRCPRGAGTSQHTVPSPSTGPGTAAANRMRWAASVDLTGCGVLLAFLADLLEPGAGSQCATGQICDESDGGKDGEGHDSISNRVL